MSSNRSMSPVSSQQKLNGSVYNISVPKFSCILTFSQIDCLRETGQRELSGTGLSCAKSYDHFGKISWSIWENMSWCVQWDARNHSACFYLDCIVKLCAALCLLTDIDECLQDLDDSDEAVTQCLNTPGSYICSCYQKNYIWNGSICIGKVLHKFFGSLTNETLNITW